MKVSFETVAEHTAHEFRSTGVVGREDIFQEAYLALLLDTERIHGADDPTAYAHAVAGNAVRKLLAKERKHQVANSLDVGTL